VDQHGNRCEYCFTVLYDIFVMYVISMDGFNYGCFSPFSLQ
jgi:hypothetical protein